MGVGSASPVPAAWQRLGWPSRELAGEQWQKRARRQIRAGREAQESQGGSCRRSQDLLRCHGRCCLHSPGLHQKRFQTRGLLAHCLQPPIPAPLLANTLLRGWGSSGANHPSRPGQPHELRAAPEMSRELTECLRVGGAETPAPPQRLGPRGLVRAVPSWEVSRDETGRTLPSAPAPWQGEIPPHAGS